MCNCFFSCWHKGMCIGQSLKKVFLRNKITDDPNSIEMIITDATILYYHSQTINENKQNLPRTLTLSDSYYFERQHLSTITVGCYLRSSATHIFRNCGSCLQIWQSFLITSGLQTGVLLHLMKSMTFSFLLQSSQTHLNPSLTFSLPELCQKRRNQELDNSNKCISSCPKPFAKGVNFEVSEM